MKLVVLLVVAWTMVLTVATLLTIRQIALLTIRMNIMNTVGMGSVESGGELGRAVDTPLIRKHLLGLSQTVTVFALGSNCNSCHEFAGALPLTPYSLSPVVCLLTGSGSVLDSLRATLPDWLYLIEEPLATELGQDLELSATQVALNIVDGRLVGRARVEEPGDLEALLTFESPIV